MKKFVMTGNRTHVTLLFYHGRLAERAKACGHAKGVRVRFPVMSNFSSKLVKGFFIHWFRKFVSVDNKFPYYT